uniref:Zinc finger, CCHC-type n=1 Tax=Tanacetum cinerariifolium TaxID=118510 RepID=A0A6L2JHT3_TANCI|nr:zinc finger, CCHC-type [Tanacetum cinerariifolium]
MAGNTVKEMTMNFGKLDKFEGHDFRRWQKKMHFLLTTLKVVYVLTTPMPKLLEDATVDAIRIRVKWENDDYICRGHILNGMSDSLFDVYTNVESAKELWDSLESKYMVEDSSSKKLLRKSLRVQESDKGKGKEVGGPSVNMIEESDSGATNHVCKDRCWFKTYELVEDGSVLYMGDDHFAPVHGKGSVYESDKYILSKSCVFVGFGYYNNGHVHYKRMLEMYKDDLIPAIDENLEKFTISPYTPQQNGVAKGKIKLLRKWAVVRLSNPKRKTLGETGINCIFVGYVEYFKTYKFYVIEPNDSVSINSIIESKDAIFNENCFSLIPIPKDIIPNPVETQRDDHSNDVPSETPEPRKDKRVQKAKSYGSDF